MKNKNIRYVLIAIVAILLIIAGLHLLSRNDASMENGSEVASTTEENLVDLAEDGVDPSALGEGESIRGDGYTITRLPDPEGEPLTTPSLTRTTPKPATMDDATFAQIQSNIQQTADILREEDDFVAWMNLSVLRSIIEDYEGSEEILVYLSKRYAPSWQVHANLGLMYGTYLNNVTEAVRNYQKAIELFPKNPGLYRSLFEVYKRDGNRLEATATLKDGITAEPRATDLYVLLARYLNEGGDTAGARTYYERAIEQANLAGNASLEASIQSELDAL